MSSVNGGNDQSLVVVNSHADGAIVEVLMNRPEARNALNQALLDELRVKWAEASQKESTRIMILSGVGRVFCAGMDLKAVRSQPEKMGDLLLTLSRFMREIRRSTQPTIARVQGAAVGGGCGLMTVCDFSMTHADSKVGYPEVDLGVCPAVVAPWLVRRIGSGRARQLLLAGGTITGERGHEFGIITHVCERDQLESDAMQLAEQLAKGGRHAMAVTKKWLNELDGSFEDEVLDEAARISADVVQGEEAQARLTAFFEKKNSSG